MRVAVNGSALFFDVEGAKVRPDGPWMRDRPTVILLPTGPGMDHTLYKEQLGPALAEDVQVIYLDLRGAGRSDWSSPEHWTLETWAADLTEFCGFPISVFHEVNATIRVYPDGSERDTVNERFVYTAGHCTIIQVQVNTGPGASGLVQNG